MSLSLPLTTLLRQAAEPELYIRSGLMSRFGKFSHIYQDEPADLLPLQTLLLFSLLSPVLEELVAALAFTQNASDLNWRSAFRLQL